MVFSGFLFHAPDLFLSLRAMNNQNKILFFGELAPRVIHGISLSNRLNVELLRNHAEVHTIEEKTNIAEHKKRNRSKIVRTLRNVREIYRTNKLEKYNYFYTVFSLSTVGSLKTLGSLAAFRASGAGRAVLHIHRGDFESFYCGNLLNAGIAKLIFRITDSLVVLSEQQKKQMARYVDPDKIRVLENSLDTEYDFGSKVVGDNRFVFISNYIEEKGIYELLDVFSGIGGLQLKCFGAFVNNQAAIEAYRSENISIGGFLSGAEKFEEIRDADALILPSWNEGQPTIILEAMMAGTLVLTTKVGLIEEMLGADYPFYFEARNQDSLKRCIEKFRRYADKEALSSALKRKYLSDFSNVKHEEKLMGIFS